MLALLCASCASYIPVTEHTADKYGLRDMRHVQLFVSDDFVLRRDTMDASAQLTPGGTIRYYRGRRIEEVRVPRHTPGEVLWQDERGMGVSFVPGGDASALLFAAAARWEERGGTDVPRDGRFAAPPPDDRGPQGPSRSGYYFIEGDDGHPLRYDGKLWTVHFDRRPYLLLRSRDITQESTSTTTLPGRRVSSAGAR